MALERTEFLRSDPSYSILARIVRATEVDTVLHTFLVVDTGAPETEHMHEINVIGTMNLCAAAGAPGSTVRTVVVKSSTAIYGTHREDPTFLREDDGRATGRRPRASSGRSPRSRATCTDFALDHPDTAVSILRYCNVLGPDITTSLTHALELPAVPCIAGFDPGLQFVHESDVVRSLRFALDRRLRGIFNVAADGLLPWSEIVALTGKRRWPLPPLGTAELAQALRRLGIVNLTPELLGLLRYGRGLDTQRLKDAGFTYLYDTPATHRRPRPDQPPAPQRRPPGRHLPVRAGRRGVLPPLARRGARAAVHQLSGDRRARWFRASSAPAPPADRPPSAPWRSSVPAAPPASAG